MKNISLVLCVLLGSVCSAAEPAKAKMKSDVLGRDMSFSILLPDSYKTEPAKRYPVIYVLDGWYSNGMGLFFNNAIGQRPFLPKFVDEKQVVVVNFGLPSDWYFDSPRDPKLKFGTFLKADLIDFVDKNYRTIARREGRAITGFSSGAHGALLLAFQEPKKFIAAGSIYGCPDLTRYVGSKPDWKLPQVLGTHKEFPENWAKLSLEPHLKNVQGTGLNVWLGCGVRDELLPDNRKLAERLKALDIEHTFHEGPGGHDGVYASVGFQECMKALETRLKRD